MATSEKIVSPGVFTNEVDQSFLPAAIGEIGGAVIGPTVKGPAMIPTVVSSMNEFTEIFGETFSSASVDLTYLTSETARQYLKHGNKLTVVRILDGEFTPATANIMTGSGTYYTGSSDPGYIDSTETALSFKLHTHNQGEILNNKNEAFESSSKATATWTFTDKGNEETTITLTDYEGTSVTFEVDNDGDGAATAGATAMDPPTNNGAGMATILASAVNDSDLKINLSFEKIMKKSSIATDVTHKPLNPSLHSKLYY